MSRRKKSPRSEPLSDEAYAALIAEVKRPKSPDEKRFIKIGWELIEAKFRYYVLDDPLLSDAEYDRLEREYKELGVKLGIDTEALYMVDFDRNRPACQLAADKIQQRNPPVNPDTIAPSASIGDTDCIGGLEDEKVTGD